MMVSMRETLSSVATRNESNLLTKKEAARFLSVSIKTLDRWIYERRGPKYYKVGGVLVRYRIKDLIAFLEACPTGGAPPTPQFGGEAA
jgi:predicted DNA-binding transcriptional regulator AlpA